LFVVIVFLLSFFYSDRAGIPPTASLIQKANLIEYYWIFPLSSRKEPKAHAFGSLEYGGTVFRKDSNEKSRPSRFRIFVVFSFVHDTKLRTCNGRKVNMHINLAGFLECSHVNGPGKRAVIWVQGCPIRCQGCFNSHMWDFKPKTLVKVNTLAEQILQTGHIEGVTFSGGEPFAQAETLGILGEVLQRHGLNVVTYSGYTFKYLQNENRNDWKRLLGVTDLLIAGPFISELRCHLPWRGSLNQSMVFLSEQFRNHPAIHMENVQTMEFIIESDGALRITGFPG
jgi:anaerobic ribonucleoside-triphosphate reductase activating protein